MEWVASDGGPLILLPVEIAHHWRGVSPPPGVPVPPGWAWGDHDGPVCDYDRACQVDDYVGTVGVGPGVGLVLGDEPMRTTFVPTGGGGILARWGYADGEDQIRLALDGADGASWCLTDHRLRVDRGGLLMIDAAYAGDDPPPKPAVGDANWCEFLLPVGTYRVEFADYRPDERTWLILIRLARTGQDRKTDAY